MAEYRYLATYGLQPPTFFKHKERDDEEFGRGEMRHANVAIMNNEWQLHDCNDNTNTVRDPLVGLHRMGLLDLIGHDEEDKVLLLITKQKNSNMMKHFLNYEGHAQTMKRIKKEFLVVENITMKNITSDQAKSCSGELRINTPEGEVYSLKLANFLENRNKKVEIWKHMQGKLRQVSTFLSYNLMDQDNSAKRSAVFSYLLSESLGDATMAMGIAKVFYQSRFLTSRLLLKNASTLLENRSTANADQKEETEQANTIVEAIDKQLLERQDKIQSGFIELCRPLLQITDLCYLHNLIENDPPHTYRNLQNRQKNTKKKTDKFCLLFDFIMEQKNRSQKTLSSFGTLMAYAVDAEGGCGISEQVSQWMNVESCPSTLRTQKKIF